MGAKITNGVLSVGGFPELTAANQERFRNHVCAALNGHTTIEVDLSRTKFMDCAGLGALISLHTLARGRNGVMRLVNPTPAVQQLFDVVGAEGMFEIVSKRPTAHPRFASQPVTSTLTLPARVACHCQSPPGSEVA